MEESSWEDVAVLQEVFPHFNLANQVCFDEGENVTESTRRRLQTEAETEKGMTTEAVAEKTRAAEKITDKGISNEEPTTGRIRRKPSWLKEYQM